MDWQSYRMPKQQKTLVRYCRRWRKLRTRATTRTCRLTCGMHISWSGDWLDWRNSDATFSIWTRTRWASSADTTNHHPLYTRSAVWPFQGQGYLLCDHLLSLCLKLNSVYYLTTAADRSFNTIQVIQAALLLLGYDEERTGVSSSRHGYAF